MRHVSSSLHALSLFPFSAFRFPLSFSPRGDGNREWDSTFRFELGYSVAIFPFHKCHSHLNAFFLNSNCTSERNRSLLRSRFSFHTFRFPLSAFRFDKWGIKKSPEDDVKFGMIPFPVCVSTSRTGRGSVSKLSAFRFPFRQVRN